jgi:hypothetical protein
MILKIFSPQNLAKIGVIDSKFYCQKLGKIVIITSTPGFIYGILNIYYLFYRYIFYNTVWHTSNGTSTAYLNHHLLQLNVTIKIKSTVTTNCLCVIITNPHFPNFKFLNATFPNYMFPNRQIVELINFQIVKLWNIQHN